MMTLNDTALIELSQVDPEAFGEIFDRHFPAIYRFCARRVGPARERISPEMSFDGHSKTEIATTCLDPTPDRGSSESH